MRDHPPASPTKEGTLRRFFYVLAAAALALAVPCCNVFNDLGKSP
jgi:hypothetical protein